MPQIVSSAIMNAPPPHGIVKMLMRTNWACEPGESIAAAWDTLPPASSCLRIGAS